ncbi:hypothetical protein [Buchnera aphidicola]|uniref:hypothetical protein n=1 Tax=Buchnera aphidicola TaxID=9 RepID=UPI0031B85E6D
MLHEILKQFIKNKNTKIYWINNKIKKYNLNKKWAKIIYAWMNNIINTKINKNGIMLSKIKKYNFVQEMKFNIFIKKKINENTFRSLFLKDKNIKFKINKGIITGIIDIVFIWKKKFYLIDFKFNYLGNKKKNYNGNKIKNVIIKNKYKIQYKIYLLGIHKYLKTNLKKYNFKKHFGGIFYLFLRSFTKIRKKQKYGKILILPKKKYIERMEKFII